MNIKLYHSQKDTSLITLYESIVLTIPSLKGLVKTVKMWGISSSLSEDGRVGITS